jgi:3-methylcrotonyl-CoA carboxylase alpha subunit
VFDRILIANRGEIACRIIRTCRRLGIATVAVYSEADRDALHVRLADQALCIGAAAARSSYLSIERVIAAAKASGAKAIHPGYGFLSENADFAERSAEAGISFIGPPVAAMRAMSSKASARELAQRTGVPVLPGYQGPQQQAAYLRREAERIGYPVLIKAVAGGGGKGMRRVDAAGEFDAALASSQREAAASFGDARVLLEKCLLQPRHIEVQVFGDNHGEVVHLFERDCSAQRRHQKVVEEAPAPALAAPRRQALLQSACELARAAGYRGAGTMEFLFDQGGAFYFIEMNTRIQVEHPVTETVTGLDLIEWQLRVAAGEPLPLRQQQIECRGHAIEARLYAEVPESGFLPSSGVLRRFELPAPTPALRVETGIEAGERVGIDYDPMLAKLIAYGADRAEALAQLQAALARVRISGLGHNVGFLRRLLANAAVRRGGIDTGFIERQLPELLRPPAADGRTELQVLAAAALYTLAQEQQRTSGAAAAAELPWARTDGWRLQSRLTRRLRFEWAAPLDSASGQADRAQLKVSQVEVHYRPDGHWLRITSATGPDEGIPEGASEAVPGSAEGPAALRPGAGDGYALEFADQVLQLQILSDSEGQLQIWRAEECYVLHRQRETDPAASAQTSERTLAAPMPGRIIAQSVGVGQRVHRGQPLLTLEAMKMEHTLCAPGDGTVRAVRVAVGDQVQEGMQLIEFETDLAPARKVSS